MKNHEQLRSDTACRPAFHPSNGMNCSVMFPPPGFFLGSCLKRSPLVASLLMGLPNILREGRFDAVLFDLDGVLTPTAKVHAKCWKRMFDEFLQDRSKRRGSEFSPFDIEADYSEYVDGKPRYDGVRSFLRSRGIELPRGDPASAPGFETICGLGNRKDALVNEILEADGVEPYPSSVDLVKELRKAGIKTAVISSSRNCQAVLRAAKLEELFNARIDGRTAERLGLTGKPAPDTFLQAAKEFKVPAERAVVVEDAISGVEAARAGRFGLVVGIARHGNASELKAHGAGVVVADLSEWV